VDEIVSEPPGGAHVHPKALFEALAEVLQRQLTELTAVAGDELVRGRQEKFRRMGRLGQDYIEEKA
jgi:acetyl-CoA carboxylase carboxyl transferase subunit alpha